VEREKKSRTTATKQRRATVARLGRRCRPSPLPFRFCLPRRAGGCRARLFPIAHLPHAALRFWAFGFRLLRLLSRTASGKAPDPISDACTKEADAANCRYSAPRDGRSGLRQRACRTKTASKRRGRVQHSLGSSREAIGGIKRAKHRQPHLPILFVLPRVASTRRHKLSSCTNTDHEMYTVCYTVLSSCHHGVRENATEDENPLRPEP
jgi:hypothetical protein